MSFKSFSQEFKQELYQKKIEIESLNHRFVCRLSPGSERPGSVSPLCDFRQRWDNLESETVGRQVRICNPISLRDIDISAPL